MLPSKSYKKMSRVANICAGACGADVLSVDFKINFITRFVSFCITFFFIFSAYTAYVRMQDGFAAVLGSLCMVGKGVQGCSKFLCALNLQKCFYDQNKFLLSVYEEYELKGEQYMQALQKSIERVQMILKMVTIFYLVGCPLTMVTPLILWLYDGQRTLVMPIVIPGFDPNTTHGYTVTVTVQLTFFALGAFGNFAGDIFFFIVVSNFNVFVDICKLKVNELNKLSADPYNAECLESLIDVLKWHQTYYKFTEDTDYIYFWINFTQITTSGASLILILIIIINDAWINAYSFLILEFAMMYMYCGMGTVVELANDGISREIYAIHWYNLTVPQQKIVKLMLMKSQSPKELTLGGIIPLSVSTGLQVTKTVYSVLMMLLNLFAE